MSAFTDNSISNGDDRYQVIHLFYSFGTRAGIFFLLRADRVQIYNTDEDMQHFQMGLDGNLGKFKENKYPYQLWEPSNQNEFEEYSQAFLNWTNASGNTKDLMYAINIDPVMFEVRISKNFFFLFSEFLAPCCSQFIESRTSLHCSTDCLVDFENRLFSSHVTFFFHLL